MTAMTATVPSLPASHATAFGPIAADAAELTFPLGLPGFPAVERFALAPVPGGAGPFHLLHGLGDEPIDLVVTPLESVGEAIDRRDVDSVRRWLQIDADALLVLLVVTLPAKGSGRSPVVNLRAPIFVDVERRIAVQTVLPNARYPFRHALAA